MSNAERRARRQEATAAGLAAVLDDLLDLRGDEVALDVGTGTGALAFALAPRVSRVVGLEQDEDLVAHATRNVPSNVELVVGDGEHLPFETASFDVGATLRVLHHTQRPELLVAELARVTRPGGMLLVADQIAPLDPLEAFELTRFEQARDPSTKRVLADPDLRGLFDSNGLVLRRERVTREPRDLVEYLDLAGCDGLARERARRLAPAGYETVTGWYVLAR